VAALSEARRSLRKSAPIADPASLRDLRALSEHIERVRENERARIAREIHDELGQTLTSLKLDLVRIAQADGYATRDAFDQVLGTVDGMFATVRRIASDLRPRVLDDFGLVAALEWQAQDFVRRTGAACRFRCRGTPRAVDIERATAVFRITQELLTNVARHAAATRVQITLMVGRTSLRLDVVDNGCGIRQLPASDDGRLGLLGMQERAAAFGGGIVITSGPSAGTRVRVSIPLRQRRSIQRT
jgi:signal transduction histidine kinase